MSVTFRVTSGLGRDYWHILLAQMASSVSAMASASATTWLVLGPDQLHADAGWLSVMLAAQFLPVLLLQGPAGRLVDSRRRTSLLMAVAAVQSGAHLVAGALTLSGAIGVPSLVAYSLLLGLTQVVEYAARQALLADVLGDRFKRGYGVYGGVLNIARALAPAAAGYAMTVTNPGAVMLVNAALSLAVIGVLRRLGDVPSALEHGDEAAAGHRGERSEDAVSARVQRRRLLAQRAPLLLVTAIAGSFCYQFPVTNALLVVERFHSDAGAYGLLSSVLTVGMTAGAFISARMEGGRYQVWAFAAAFGAVQAVSSIAPGLPVYAGLLFAAGLFFACFTNNAVTAMKEGAPPVFRGSMMSAYNAALIGLIPAGTLTVDLLTDRYGVGWALAGPALVCIVAATASLALVAGRVRQVTT